MPQDEIANLLKQISTASIRLLDALERGDEQLCSTLVDDLDVYLQSLHNVAVRDKKDIIANSTLSMQEEIRAIKATPLVPQSRQGRELHVKNILGLSSGRLEVHLPALKEPGNYWLTYLLSVLIAAFNAKMAQSGEIGEPSVAALVVTSEHKRIFATNVFRLEMPAPTHAEINALLEAMTTHSDPRSLSLFQSNIPCFYSYRMRIERTNAGIMGTVLLSTDDRLMKPPLNVQEWQVIRSMSPGILYLNKTQNVQVMEVYTNEEKTTSIVYYLFGKEWMPREARYYTKENGIEYVEVRTGCAVTIGILRVKEVYYIVHSKSEESKFAGGLNFMKSWGVAVSSIVDEDFRLLGMLAKQGKQPLQQQLTKMDIIFARLSLRLHVLDIKQILVKRFDIP